MKAITVEPHKPATARLQDIKKIDDFMSGSWRFEPECGVKVDGALGPPGVLLELDDVKVVIQFAEV